MSKRKTFMISFAVTLTLLAALLCGCGGAGESSVPAPEPTPEPASASDLKTPAPAPEPTPEPASASDLKTPAPASDPANESASASDLITPAPAPTPVPASAWFETSGLQFADPKAFQAAADVSDRLYIGDELMDLITEEDVEAARHALIRGELTIETVDQGDGTKVITAAYSVYPYILYRREQNTETHVSGIVAYYGFVDKLTGKAVVFDRWDEGESQELSVAFGGETWHISIEQSYVGGQTVTDYEQGLAEPLVEKITVTCPADYDGCAFFFRGGTEFEIDAMGAITDYEALFTDGCEPLLFNAD